MNRIYVLTNRFNAFKDFIRTNDLDELNYYYINGEERGLQSIRPNSEFIDLGCINASAYEVLKHDTALKTLKLNNCIEIEK